MENKYVSKANYYELLAKLANRCASKNVGKDVHYQALYKLANWFEGKTDYYQTIAKLFKCSDTGEYGNAYFEPMIEDTMLAMKLILATLN